MTITHDEEKQGTNLSGSLNITGTGSISTANLVQSSNNWGNSGYIYTGYSSPTIQEKIALLTGLLNSDCSKRFRRLVQDKLETLLQSI